MEVGRRWRRRTVSAEQRSENSGIKKDEAMGFNLFQHEGNKRQMCGPEDAGGAQTLLLLQCHSKEIGMMKRSRPRLNLGPLFPFGDFSHKFSPCFYCSHRSGLILISSPLSDKDKHLNLILRILRLIGSTLRAHPALQPVPPPQ